MNVRFEWDNHKAASNFEKHKVSFDEAATVFNDTVARIFIDKSHSFDEHREIIIGHSVYNRLLLVCFTERAKDIIRIISARVVTKKERKDYEENQTL